MRNKIEELLKEIFSVCIIIAIFGGGVIFLMFMLALIVGGEYGANMALAAKDLVMPILIITASLGILAGLLYSYSRKSHGLSL